MRQHLALLTLLGALSIVAAADGQAPTLHVGNNPPDIQAKFVKGGAVKSFEKGTVYVVEFWATWCGPCKEAIPHLTELAKKYKDKASFVGVSVWEDDQAKVEPFVKEFGSKMDYHVAMDDQVSPTAREGKMSKSWMEAAGQDGIPTAFVIDQDSKIAWIGSPFEIEKPLELIVEKKWDRDSFAKQEAEKWARENGDTSKDPIFNALTQFKSQMEAKQYANALKTIAVIEKSAPTSSFPDPMQVGISLNLSVNLAQNDMPGWYATAARYADAFKKNPHALGDLAWQIADPMSKLSVRKGKFAVKVAKMAVERSNYQDGSILDTLAWSYRLNGQKKLAIATEKMAIQRTLDDDARKQMRANLEKFQAE